MELFCAEFPLMLLTLCEMLHSLPLGAPGRVDVYLCVQQILKAVGGSNQKLERENFCTQVRSLLSVQPQLLILAFRWYSVAEF